MACSEQEADLGGLVEIQLGRVKIGHDLPCVVIAECCQNHMGDVGLAMEMATQAKRCGADVVKFQHHLPSDIRRHRRSLKIEEHRKVREHCDSIGIQWLCTPFGKQAVDEIAPFSDGFKVGRGQDTGIFEKLWEFRKPIIYTYSGVVYADDNAIVLKCDRIKPLMINQIQGLSCHKPNNYSAFAAVALGAKVIEKHVIWDRGQICADQYNSIDFNQLHDLVIGVREIERGLK